MNLVPTAVAAVALGVKPEAVRQMRKRGKLTRYGTPQRALVDLAEVEALLVDDQGAEVDAYSPTHFATRGVHHWAA